MIHLQRKIKCKFTGSEEYQPEGIAREKWFPVIGYEIRKREKKFENKIEMVEDVFYLVTNEKGRMITLASFNCSTMIDEQAELSGGQLMQLLNNILSMGKVLSEKLAKFPDKKGSDSGENQT